MENYHFTLFRKKSIFLGFYKLFFVAYLAYVNMSILDEKYFELIPEMMD